MRPYLQMTLSECAKNDKDKGLRHKLTGWGKICAERAAKGLRRRKNIRKARKMSHQAYCQQMAANGLINNADGKFVQRNQVLQSQMVSDYFAGYKLT